MKKEAEKEMWNQLLRVFPTRVRRTYRGGRSLDLWHGKEAGKDGDCPEEWLASITQAVNPGFPLVENEGLSSVSAGGKPCLLKELIERAPQEMLGRKHFNRYGAKTGVLAKLLDPAERLSIQVHPDKAFAKKYFHSEYGKTECWHILDVREIDGQKPYLLMGFAPGVTEERWRQLYENQDIPQMVNCLNRMEPVPGETYLIPGGLPHAIGPGCYMVEIQEPTDYTLRTERTMADGKPIPDGLIHQGLGNEGLLRCFHYENWSEEQIQNRYGVLPKKTMYNNGSSCSLLVGPGTTNCFAMEKIAVKGTLSFGHEGHFLIAAVLSGKGKICHAEEEEEIKTGDQFFIPASMGDFAVEGECVFLCCYPPGISPVPPVEI